MSSTSISATAASAFQQVNFSGHRRKAGGANSLSSGATIGALPVGAGQNLLRNALQSLNQTVAAAAVPASSSAVGASGAVAASGVASTAPASPAAGSATLAPLTQDLQGFMHSLFAALKQDGLGSAASSGSAATATAAGTSASAAAAGAGATTTAGSAGQYQGSLVSSLQTLIQQLGGTQAGQVGSGATGELTASFNKLTAAAGASSASTTSPASSTASTAQLKNFLSDFLQTLQSGGGQLQGTLGSHVNANA
jgi:hypothetical protein